MQYFNFVRLIKKFSNEFTAVIPSDGGYNNAGDWVPGTPTRVTLNGAIISMKESRILRSQGAYTSQDRALHMLEPLPDALKKAEIIYKGRKYSVASELENSEFTGVYSYVLKHISVFNEGGETVG